jgi:two-component system phosphate regulon sensor histidine kinase PhoR
VAFSATAIITLLQFILEQSIDWRLTIATVLIIGLTSFIWIYWSIEKFIYQKIKIIYKTIHRFKSGKDNKKDLSMKDDMLAEVNKDVMDWAENRIQEIRELREKDSFRKEFIGNLSHELKTPIFSIQGYILTLLEGALEDPENNRKFLMKAAKSVDRITMLLQDLDSITKIESGNLKLNKEKFDIVELTREVFESLEHKAKKNNVELIIANPGQIQTFVDADRSKIAQVLTNLIVNSINYGKDGGRTKVRFYDMDENVLIEVADNGLGMSEEHLPRVFERFYRVDKSRSRHVGGSGLGLSIVKHIIDSHGQTINVRSTENVGSTFSFTLKKA